MKNAARKTPNQDPSIILRGRRSGTLRPGRAARPDFSWERPTDHSQNRRFQRVAHGIYRLARFPASRLGDLFVARLKGGPKSAISHESALVLDDSQRIRIHTSDHSFEFITFKPPPFRLAQSSA